MPSSSRFGLDRPALFRGVTFAAGGLIGIVGATYFEGTATLLLILAGFVLILYAQSRFQ